MNWDDILDLPPADMSKHKIADGLYSVKEGNQFIFINVITGKHEPFVGRHILRYRTKTTEYKGVAFVEENSRINIWSRFKDDQLVNNIVHTLQQDPEAARLQYEKQTKKGPITEAQAKKLVQLRYTHEEIRNWDQGYAGKVIRDACDDIRKRKKNND